MPDLSGLVWLFHIAFGAVAAFVVAVVLLLASIFVTISFPVAFALMMVAGAAAMAVSAGILK
ncbi:MAG: hypothetical protein CMJ42_22995 [Phyllobacteriaceae bacterium]|nr:hypothetical protein [Phyllobacteriaceae bacterium]|tara:strand:+ start:191 stop:376 length:186 start_codon:yes stop_codon:yes gene_type:complete